MRPEDSIEIITSMMSQTRRNVLRHCSVPFLVWGWSSVVVGIVVYLFVTITGNPAGYYIWLSLPVIGTAIMAIKRRRREKTIRTVLDQPLHSIWKMLTVVLVCFSAGSFFIEFNILFFILFILAIGCYVTGAIIRYPLLRWSSLIGFGVSTATLFVFGQRQILFFVISIIGMMIIPGYKMKQDLKNERT